MVYGYATNDLKIYVTSFLNAQWNNKSIDAIAHKQYFSKEVDFIIRQWFETVCIPLTSALWPTLNIVGTRFQLWQMIVNLIHNNKHNKRNKTMNTYQNGNQYFIFLKSILAQYDLAFAKERC